MPRVIKNFEGSRQARDSRVFDMTELGEEARRIIASAEDEAARILLEAKAEAERLRSEAYARGLEKGKSAVRGEIELRLAEEIRNARHRETLSLVNSLRAMIARIDESRDRLLHDAKEQLISLAIHIARSVVKREVRCADDVARLNLDEAIRLSARRSKLLIHVSEMDMNMLETVLNGQPLVNDHQAAVELVPSSEILPGGCLVETASGTVDARIETQLGEIEKVLLGENGHG